MDVRSEIKLSSPVAVLVDLVKECVGSGLRGEELKQKVFERLGDLKDLKPEDILKEVVEIFEKLSVAESTAKTCFASLVKVFTGK